MDKWNGQGLPPVGTECQVSNHGNAYEWCLIRYMGENLCVVDHKSHNDQHYYLGSHLKFRPLKSEAERKRDEAVEQLVKTLSDSGNYLTPKCSFVFKRIEELEQGTMCMSYNDGPAKGIIRDLYRVVDNDDGSKELAEMLHDAGYRKVNPLTYEQIQDYVEANYFYSTDLLQERVRKALTWASSQIIGEES